MAYQIDIIRESFSQNWRFDNMLDGSIFARIFPNQLLQDGGQFNSIVKFPVMTEAVVQENWNQQTGFNELDSTERVVEVALEKNFTVYTKIAKINVPANAASWAYGKQQTITNQESAEVDDYILNKLCNGVTQKVDSPVNLTVLNLYAELQRMEKQARTLKFKLKNCLILVSPKVNRIIVQNNISTGATTIEGSNATVSRIFGKFTIMETNIDDFGFDILAVIPTAFAFASAIETPLQAGEYTQGSFFGQIFVAMNRFYGANILMPNQILGYEAQEGSSTFAASTPIQDGSLQNYKNLKKDLLIETYSSNENFNSFFEEFLPELAKATTTIQVDELIKNFTELMS